MPLLRAILCQACDWTRIAAIRPWSVSHSERKNMSDKRLHRAVVDSKCIHCRAE